MKTNKWSVWLLSFLLSFPVLSTAESVKYTKFAAGIFEIRGKRNFKQVKLDVNISDWKISCNRKIAIVWGQTLKTLEIGVPPYAAVYIIDLIRGRILNSYTTSRGPFDVEFVKDKPLAFVDDFIVDTKTGKIISTSNLRSQDIERERCEDFLGRKSE